VSQKLQQFASVGVSRTESASHVEDGLGVVVSLSCLDCMVEQARIFRIGTGIPGEYPFFSKEFRVVAHGIA
jgi:hypothetical protein